MSSFLEYVLRWFVRDPVFDLALLIEKKLLSRPIYETQVTIFGEVVVLTIKQSVLDCNSIVYSGSYKLMNGVECFINNVESVKIVLEELSQSSKLSDDCVVTKSEKLSLQEMEKEKHHIQKSFDELFKGIADKPIKPFKFSNTPLTFQKEDLELFSKLFNNGSIH